MKKLIVIGFLLLFVHSFGQKQGRKPVKKTTPVDTAYTDYNLLFSEMDLLLDSLTKPRSFATVDVGVGNASFDFYGSGNDSFYTAHKILVSPMVGYFHQSGLGISAEASAINDNNAFNPYQFALTGYYDYLHNRKFLTGVSFVHYFTRQDLSFYTSPLENEMQAYFTYRKTGIKPSVNLRYGWGNEESTTVLQQLQKKNKNKTVTTTQNITTQKHVGAFNLTTSARYDFYWMDVFSKKDYIRVTPQVSLISGSQEYIFNQQNNIVTARGPAGKNTTYSTENTVFNSNSKFQPLSFTAYLKTEYAKGRFFVQPLVAVDYYLPAEKDNITVSFLLNAGYLFL